MYNAEGTHTYTLTRQSSEYTRYNHCKPLPPSHTDNTPSPTPPRHKQTPTGAPTPPSLPLPSPHCTDDCIALPSPWLGRPDGYGLVLSLDIVLVLCGTAEDGAVVTSLLSPNWQKIVAGHTCASLVSQIAVRSPQLTARSAFRRGRGCFALVGRAGLVRRSCWCVETGSLCI